VATKSEILEKDKFKNKVVKNELVEIIKNKYQEQTPLIKEYMKEKSIFIYQVGKVVEYKNGTSEFFADAKTFGIQEEEISDN